MMQATAFVIGEDNHCSQGLMDLSLDIGFRSVIKFSNIELAEQQVKRTPVCFFLFALAHNSQNFLGIARTIRTSRNRQIKFAPMIGFTESAEPRLIQDALGLGFDDILVPPFSAKVVLPRLNNHIIRQIHFYETGKYFGPDRRAGLSLHKELENHPDQSQDGDHRKILINRSLETGLGILKDEFHKRHPASPADDVNSYSI